MHYYKLINNKAVVGVASSLDFRRFQKKHQILLLCDEEQGQYLQCGESLYRDNWMRPVTTDAISYESAEVIAIDEEEYGTLQSVLGKGEEIAIEPQEEWQEEPSEAVGESPDVTLQFIRSVKLREMNAACRKAITDGFNVALSDGESRHFSLTLQDQLNLSALSAAISVGETGIPYHADEEPCRYYPAEDISVIIGAAERHKRYHTTYYNSLKRYVNSLDDMEAISAVMYGTEIPAAYWSEVWRDILKDEEGQANGGSDV